MEIDLSCPGCGTLGSVREIVYGMPGSDFEFDKYIVGGCCVTVSDPKHGCVECGWRGFVLKSMLTSKICKPSEFKCPSCGDFGTMRQILQGLQLAELEDASWRFSKTYEDEPLGNVVCRECGWSCIGQNWSSWLHY